LYQSGADVRLPQHIRLSYRRKARTIDLRFALRSARNREIRRLPGMYWLFGDRMETWGHGAGGAAPMRNPWPARAVGDAALRSQRMRYGR
jgi:hypothetical protein